MTISRSTDYWVTDYRLLRRGALQQSPAVLGDCWYLACSAVGERHSVVDSIVDRLAELLGKESHSAHPSALLSGELAGDELHGLAVVAVQKNS
jgi:hypothetical protein